MPPSQLNRLKSSLREQGITGPAKSKKQKKELKNSKDGNARVQRHAALQQIRDSFNPFEIKAPSRPTKFEHTSFERPGKKLSYKDVLHRPGVTKSAGEEMRKTTLLPELQRRNKVGALIDRRIGEGDPGMTAEERALQRFAREKSRSKGANVFDLEAGDDDEPKVSLTHGGRRLDELPEDDFGSISGSEASDAESEDFFQRKRSRDVMEVEDHAQVDDNLPERKKSKKEVMQEVIAKSKFHKYERQKTKEDDDDLREELDKGTQDVLALLRGNKPLIVDSERSEVAENGTAVNSGPHVNPNRQRLLDGMDRSQMDREYEARLRQYAQDARAKPSERTKTEEEKATEEAARLRDLEEKRVKRMHGEMLSDDEERSDTPPIADVMNRDDEIVDEAEVFGFTNSDPQSKQSKQQLVLDDEDEFELDDDLVASGSDQELASDDSSEDESGEENVDTESDESDEFVKGILGNYVAEDTMTINTQPTEDAATLKFTYPCPQSHEELLAVLEDTAIEQLPVVIQRIRALHHPSLAPGNKAATAQFPTVLVDHLSYMGAHRQLLQVAEQVIRHLHSLSRTYALEIAHAFRRHLSEMSERKTLHGGDLFVLTAIGSIYPTSDHFHQVVTPAMTIIARWLGLHDPNTTQKSATGAFLVALCLQYQRLSKRYVPEAVRFTLRAIPDSNSTKDNLASHIANLERLAELWSSNPSLVEILKPFEPYLRTKHPITLNRIKISIASARRNRRPLELHHHRPLAIRASYPKFEAGFQPGQHYDVDADRAASARLRHEHARERKAALRELRKDANFVARVQLREKRARDEEYEKKYRRLVAEVQNEEGARANEYEREKANRKRKKRSGH